MTDAPLSVELAWREVPEPPEAIAALAALRGRSCPWLLDSALRESPLARHSFAGADPLAVWRLRGDHVEPTLRAGADAGLAARWRPRRHASLADLLRQLPRLEARVAAPPVPFVGGALAMLGYELAEAFEPVALGGVDDLGLPDACLLLVDRLLAWDHRTGRAYACALGIADGPEAATAAAESGLQAIDAWLRPAPPPPRRPRAAAAPGPVATPAAFDAPAYAKAVQEVKDEIAAGNVYQANLTQRMERRFAGDPWSLYRALRAINPAPFACYVELPELAVVGSSPERFLRVEPDGTVESRPIKGTRPRGGDAAEDRRLRDELASSEKDRAENLMIVDLVRNDLGRVCVVGSVEVPELMQVEAYASVHQLVSTVRGTLRPGCDVADLLAASFPPGSMTGAPKIAALRVIDHLEPVRRALYSGAIGYLDARGGADLCVVIRTLFVQGDRAVLHAGGGVVADSEPMDEWRESLLKARALLEALDRVGAVAPR